MLSSKLKGHESLSVLKAEALWLVTVLLYNNMQCRGSYFKWQLPNQQADLNCSQGTP